MRRATAVVAAGLGLAGCLKLNTGFDPSGTASTGPAATTTEAGITAPGTTAPDHATGPASSDTGSATDSASTSTGALAQTTSASATDASTAAGTTGPGCEGTPADQCGPLQQIAGRSYRFCERLSTWDEAKGLCAGRCEHLVKLDMLSALAVLATLRVQMTEQDMQEEQSGGEQTAMPRASWWIGGHRQGDGFVWLDGTPLPPNGTGGWGPNDPDGGDTDQCVAFGVYAKEQDNGKWFDRNCVAVPYRFICEPDV